MRNRDDWRAFANERDSDWLTELESQIEVDNNGDDGLIEVIPSVKPLEEKPAEDVELKKLIEHIFANGETETTLAFEGTTGK